MNKNDYDLGQELQPKTEPPLQEAWGKCYIGTKVVRAEPMNYETWTRSQNKWVENQETLGNGYRVQYEDGYISWSPEEVFDRCYRLMTKQEMRIAY